MGAMGHTPGTAQLAAIASTSPTPELAWKPCNSPLHRLILRIGCKLPRLLLREHLPLEKFLGRQTARDERADHRSGGGADHGARLPHIQITVFQTHDQPDHPRHPK
jgi:hypothetical protein